MARTYQGAYRRLIYGDNGGVVGWGVGGVYAGAIAVEWSDDGVQWRAGQLQCWYDEASSFTLSTPGISVESQRAGLLMVAGRVLSITVVAEIWPSSIRVAAAAMVNSKVKRRVVVVCMKSVVWPTPRLETMKNITLMVNLKFKQIIPETT